MLSGIWAGIKALGVALNIFSWFQRRAERAEQQEIGATKQKAADLGKAVATKDRQLEIASRPDDTREELLAKAKKRKRNA